LPGRMAPRTRGAPGRILCKLGVDLLESARTQDVHSEEHDGGHGDLALRRARDFVGNQRDALPDQRDRIPPLAQVDDGLLLVGRRRRNVRGYPTPVFSDRTSAADSSLDAW